MKQVGIWLDKRTAYIITKNEAAKQELEIVRSKIEEYNIGGGSGTKFKGGPQNVVQDGKYLEREKHQTKAYFKDIAAHVEDAEEIVIFGPAETARKFQKELNGNYAKIALKVNGLTTTDSMTENQMKAWVNEYFSS